MSIRRLVFATSLYLGLAGCQVPGLQDLGDSGGASYAQPLAAQGNMLTALHQRGRELLEIYQPTLFRNSDVKDRGYDTIAYTALRGCGPSQMSDNLVDTLRPDLIAKSADKAAYAFVLPPFTRYLLEYGSCLSPDQVERARGFLATPQKLFIHGTLNHAMMSASSYYLLAEHFPDQKWYDADGKPHTSAEVVSRYKTLLLARFSKFMSGGFNEQLSPTYAVASLFPLLNLIDFARDPEVRMAAEQLSVAQIAIMRADSLDGALLPPLERENPPLQITSDPPTNARDLLWFYYGDFGPIEGRRYELPYGAMLVASSWRPPQQLLALKSNSDLPYEISINTPTFSVWGEPTQPELVGGAWIDRDFAIASGNAYPDPSGYNDHAVTFRILLRGLQPDGVIECYQPYWLANEGEDAWDTDRSSPFQQTWRSGKKGVLLYDIPYSDPFKYPISNTFFAERAKSAAHLHQLAECRLPRAANEIDVTQRGVFARYGEVFVALRSLSDAPTVIDRNPMASNLRGFITLKVRAPRAAFSYFVEERRLGETLSTFEQRALSDGTSYDQSSDTVTTSTNTQRKVTITFNQSLSLSGKQLISSPLINGVAQGIDSRTFVKSPVLTISDGFLSWSK